MSEAFQTIDHGSVTSPEGFSAGGMHSGLRRSKRHDLGVLYCDVPATTAAVYTTNLFQAAPLQVTQKSIAVSNQLQAVVVNSVNANACTGKQGELDALAMRSKTADMFKVEEHHVAVASTGVIGEPMPIKKILAGIEQMPQHVNKENGDGFNRAILTTDLTTKSIAVKLNIDGKEVRIGGAAKGSGMIHPNMATMLAFITTDAKVEQSAWKSLLSQTTNKTFNMITVDGDTSTNDMVITMASGKIEHEILSPSHPEWNNFEVAFSYVLEQLAKAIARDGEGASKLVEVIVEHAPSERTAQVIAKQIIGSSLVKTAVFGADANWGRIISSMGSAGETFDPQRIDIHIGDIKVLHQSQPVPFDENKAAAYMKESQVTITVNLHQGDERAVAWGCDLSYEYVRINSAYRT
ncbi:bifunctional glutamate N-acetyltransferase/amino-acid acetyltransferase ArgJ [Longirhabdus pacifica]|uniref:bifunctional glutamate N-acetyltransferase/amino-acid acetyltransferase ArgJ n=1 Tax=Longirhabdus pacifica TaxID=2305227 RepID=UPI001008A951|nr:bifunctional glutamate N-acetyltransferase/amino-acid acetyltransferase ArgJ [Longirhabdus pacifica]